MLLMIDNYDSFTYNLVQYFLELGVEVKIYRNDQITVTQAQALAPSHIVISPGPGSPQAAKISRQIVEQFAGKVPLLGVCLGHQIIAELFGAKVGKADRIMHGKTSLLRHDNSTLFMGLNNPLQITRYHSLIVDPATLPAELMVNATVEDPGYKEVEIMAIAHRLWPVYGVQFHPESIMTEQGHRLLANFLKV